SFVPLLLSDQLAHVAVRPVLVFHNFGTAIGMDDRIVPCRHDLPVQSLRRIGAREMTFNDSIRSIPLEHRWEVIGMETTGAARYERSSKGPGAHQRVHLRDILDAIMIRRYAIQSSWHARWRLWLASTGAQKICYKSERPLWNVRNKSMPALKNPRHEAFAQ